jgi:DNA-binding HxlR family transcriptional regulator
LLVRQLNGTAFTAEFVARTRKRQIPLGRLNHRWLDNATVSYNGLMSMTVEDQLTDRTPWRPELCSIAKTLDLQSTKTTFLVLRECFYGTTRFEDFVNRVPTSAPALSRALKQLESAQIVTRVPYRSPPAGEDLLPVVMSLHCGETNTCTTALPHCHSSMRVCVATDSDLPETLSSDIEIRATFTLD